MRQIVVFSGSAHPGLAREICDHLGTELSPASIRRFSNDCLEAQLLANCRERDVFIIQPLVPPVQEHLMELLLMLDAARGASAARTTAVIPYFAYARSDKKAAPRISIAGRLVADLLATAGARRVLTMTLHAPQVHGFFSIPVDHLNALGVLAAHFRDRVLANTVVVSPDLGNAKSAAQFARLLGLPVAAGTKRRISDDRVVIETIVGDVADKNVIVMDDEIANAGTLVELLDRLRERRVGRIAVACTHGLFTGQAVERLSGQPDIDEIVTTSTVPLAPEKCLPNLRVLSVAPLLAEAMRRIHEGESVSSLFTEIAGDTSGV
ncbi:MAG: ribose-phosphate pyrophosphokinase [Chloroflexi bacterium]|nr:ribose-phosphate pyrophosphokinase [Chloroflexota bacterium]